MLHRSLVESEGLRDAGWMFDLGGVDVKRIPEMGTSLSIGKICSFPCKLLGRREIINLEKCPDGVGQNDILDIEGLNF